MKKKKNTLFYSMIVIAVFFPLIAGLIKNFFMTQSALIGIGALLFDAVFIALWSYAGFKAYSMTKSPLIAILSANALVIVSFVIEIGSLMITGSLSSFLWTQVVFFPVFSIVSIFAQLLMAVGMWSDYLLFSIALVIILLSFFTGFLSGKKQGAQQKT